MSIFRTVSNFTQIVPQRIEKVTRDISRKKSFRLKIGSVLFVAALAATSISIVWLGAQPAKDTQAEQKTVHIVMTNDGADLRKNTSGLSDEETLGILHVVLLIPENQSSLASVQQEKAVAMNMNQTFDVL